MKAIVRLIITTQFIVEHYSKVSASSFDACLLSQRSSVRSYQL